jgi:hypothetical protein
LYRQSQIYARQGITLDRSTLADWVGRAAFHLKPVHEHLLSRLKVSAMLGADRRDELIAAGWVRLRAERDARLAACDWTQLPDSPVDKSAWASYRQALRDIPQATAKPFEVVRPEEPR